MFHGGAGPLRRRSSGVAIRPAILEAAGDAPVVTKRYPDAFQDADLGTRLTGLEELPVCGMMTQNCVVFTSLPCAADDVRITVVGDLCAAPAEIVHQIALRALSSKTEVTTAAQAWR